MADDLDMPATGTWEERGGWVVRALMRDLDLTIEQTGGIVGNLGFESAGFTELHEIGQPEGVGGYGWGQWTGPRRETFFAYVEAHGLDWRSDEANYGYLLTELRGAYRHTVDALRQCATLEQAVFSVGQTYERPGGTTADHLPGYDGRLDYARRAVAGAQAMAALPADSAGPSRPIDAAPTAKPRTALAIQTALLGAGYDPGPLDNIWGNRSKAAMAAWEHAQ